MAEETKHDLLLKRAQVIIAILGGLAAVILGFYNVKKSIFSDHAPGNVLISVTADGGAAVAQARVELYDAQNALITSSETDVNGVYQLKEITAGNYILRTTASHFEPQAATLRVDPKKMTQLSIVLKGISTPTIDNPIRSAFEDVGASWIKKLGKTDTTQK